MCVASCALKHARGWGEHPGPLPKTEINPTEARGGGDPLRPFWLCVNVRVSRLRPPLLIAVREGRSGCHRRIDPSAVPQDPFACAVNDGGRRGPGSSLLLNDRSLAIGRCTE